MKPQFNPIKINVPAEIDPYQVMMGLSYEEGEEFILQLDLAMADAGFTENVVLRLLKSLKGDLLSEEREELIDKIHKILKDD